MARQYGLYDRDDDGEIDHTKLSMPSLCHHRLVLPHGSMSLTYSVVQFLGSIITVQLSLHFRRQAGEYLWGIRLRRDTH